MSRQNGKAALVLYGIILFTFGFQNVQATEASRVFSKYRISIAGIPIGNANVTAYFTQNAFSISADGRTAGISRLVSDGWGTFRSDGIIGSQLPVPGTFRMDTVDDKIVTKVRMGMSAGDIDSLFATPPLSQRPDRVPVLEEHYKGVLDPLSAFLIRSEENGKIEPEKACNRTIPVFDGWQRFDVGLSFHRTDEEVNLGGRDGYSGPVFVCKARYIPIAGHRAGRKTTRYLANRSNIELWFAPVQGLPTLIPVYIKIGTKIGPLTLSTSIFELSNTHETVSSR